MKRVFVYFHGYRSSPDNPKVARIRTEFPDADVYSFPIDVDVRNSLSTLSDSILQMLTEYVAYDEFRLTFVGTSLGAWYAAVLGVEFGAEQVLINPSYKPHETLLAYEEAKEFAPLYHTMPLVGDDLTVLISTGDSVIDHTELLMMLSAYSYTHRLIEFHGGSHRFDSPDELNLLIDALKH